MRGKILKVQSRWVQILFLFFLTVFISSCHRPVAKKADSNSEMTAIQLQQKIEKLENVLKRNPSSYNWKIHNELRKLYSKYEPRKSLEHSNVILRHSLMDSQILRVLSGAPTVKDKAGVRSNLLALTQGNIDLKFVCAASYIKIGDIYYREKNLKEAESFYIRVSEDNDPDLVLYRSVAEERLSKIRAGKKK